MFPDNSCSLANSHTHQHERKFCIYRFTNKIQKKNYYKVPEWLLPGDDQPILFLSISMFLFCLHCVGNVKIHQNCCSWLTKLNVNMSPRALVLNFDSSDSLLANTLIHTHVLLDFIMSIDHRSTLSLMILTEHVYYSKFFTTQTHKKEVKVPS